MYTLQKETVSGERIMEIEQDRPVRDRKDNIEGWNFQTAGLTRTEKVIWKPVVRMVMSAEQSNRLSFILFIFNEVDACVGPFFIVEQEESVRKDFVNKMRWLGLRRQIQKTFSTR